MSPSFVVVVFTTLYPGTCSGVFAGVVPSSVVVPGIGFPLVSTCFVVTFLYSCTVSPSFVVVVFTTLYPGTCSGVFAGVVPSSVVVPGIGFPLASTCFVVTFS